MKYYKLLLFILIFSGCENNHTTFWGCEDGYFYDYILSNSCVKKSDYQPAPCPWKLNQGKCTPPNYKK